MEATAALKMVIGIHTGHQGHIFFLEIFSDDDLPMRAKESNETSNVHRKLPVHISAPIFKADPGHMIKTKAAKSTSTLEISDAMQYRMYIGCCIKKLSSEIRTIQRRNACSS